MSGFRVQRYNYSRSRRGGGTASGCVFGVVLLLLLLGGCGVLYATGTLSAVVLQLLGAERVGDTDALFTAGTPEPVPVFTEVSVPNIAVVDLGEFGRVDLTDANIQIVLGTQDDGLPIARANFTESGLLTLCRQRSEICQPRGEAGYRNLRFDLRPGGGVVYVEVQAGPLWQLVGLVMQIDRAGRIDVIGIDVDGTTYNPDALPVILPADVRAAVSQLVVDVEQEGNALLRRAFLDMGSQVYRIREVFVDDIQLTVVMR